MEYDLSYDDSPSLKQTLADLLRGMSKKQAYQEIGQGIQNVAKVTPSVVESLGRGAVAQVPGTFGDISELARQFAPETMQSVMGNRVAPTTEEILAKIPRLNPDYQGSSQHETIGSLISPAMPSLLRTGAKATQNMPIGNMIAYHGTPHEIQGAFDLKKVGTGEGAQAYGHGMYFAESPKVAETYALEVPKNISKDAYSAENIAKRLFNGGFDENYVTNRIKSVLPNANDEIITKAIENAKTGKVGGNLYKVDVPDQYIPKMIDFDSPISKQPKEFVELLKDVSKNENFDPFEHLALAQTIGKHPRNAPNYKPTGEELMNNVADILGIERNGSEFSKIMKEYGIKGVRYLDEGSRGKEKGTSNFVVFDPKEVKILEKNSKPVSRKDILEEQLNNIKK